MNMCWPQMYHSLEMERKWIFSCRDHLSLPREDYSFTPEAIIFFLASFPLSGQKTLNGFTNSQSRVVDYPTFGGIFAMTRSTVMMVSHPLEEWQYLPRRDWRERSWLTFSLRCSWKAHKSHNYQEHQIRKWHFQKAAIILSHPFYWWYPIASFERMV